MKTVTSLMKMITVPVTNFASTFSGPNVTLGLSYGKTLGEIIRFPADIARAQFANRQSQWLRLDSQTVAQQQSTADFYLANGLIRAKLDVTPTFDNGFSVPAAQAHAEVAP